MRVLWFCSTIIPEIATVLNDKVDVTGGWISALFHRVKTENIELVICAPSGKEAGNEPFIIENRVKCYIYPSNNSVYKYDSTLENRLKTILGEVEPDIIHIFGTENVAAWAMMKVADPRKTLVGIQGLASSIYQHMCADLPGRVLYGFTLRDIIRRDNLYLQIQHMRKRAEIERKILSKAYFVTGRTEFDYACVHVMNPEVSYFNANEMLREPFYSGEWELSTCKKHSIYISQCRTPYKGLHYALQALKIVLHRFPDTKLYVAGNSTQFTSKFSKTYYGKYVNELMEKLSVKNNVVFLGPLNAEQVKEALLSSHVFVLPSTIENSSNALGEAMLLGLPVISSYVGGVVDWINHGVNGFLYQHNAPYMLANYICKIFESDDLAVNMGKSAQSTAVSLFNSDINANSIINAYNSICTKKDV